MAGWRRLAARMQTLVMWTALAGVTACAAAGGGSGSSMPANNVVGGGGQIDQTYREIYHPGSGTNF